MLAFANYFWEHPLLKSHIRELDTGAVLFHQNEMGQSMFIILSGLVELLAEEGPQIQVVTIIEPGQFLGEQAIIRDSPFRRVFGARARCPVKVLELNKAGVEKIQLQSPPLLIDILKGIFSVASDRLHRANQMITILRSSNNEARLLSLILFFCKTAGHSGPQGIEVVVESSTIRYYVEMSEAEIQASLAKWEDALLISRSGRGVLTVFDEPALAASLSALADVRPIA
ncbi:MAG: Crp/Fnr family transcriptional regulator [Deltaproteobacteria bacterium]|nr:Crp/Fnr family transcriptional regulator [Deltaproteobacteria bacterium]MBI3296382.1 Crp/Fnr family transcriptional regulator [Deltaproteobacteria bacterium]